ncbi:MAG: metallophosphoesterase [Polyangiaceae bacterium]
MPLVTYVTDVEGIGAKLDTFVAESPWLAYDTEGRLELHDDATFVFGGDAVDRGPDGRRVVRTLLDAKERYGDRVVLVAGNRDINKLRLPRELEGAPPPWLRDVPVGSPRAVVLRAILANTMGARAAFDHRQDELRREGVDADDDAVVRSFLDDLAPGGPHLRYLEHAVLAFRSGSTLFVHGAVSGESLGHVPGCDPEPDVDRWIDRLNAFYRSQIRTFAERDASKEASLAHTAVPYAPLVKYQAPVFGSGQNPSSVVYGRTVDEANNPVLPDDEAIARLVAAGIRRVVVGHTPSGDTPTILRGEGFEMIVADNSYGSLDWGAGVDVDEDGVTIRGRATLESGDVVSVGFSTHGTAWPHLGSRDVATGEIVKGPVADGRSLLFKYGPRLKLVQRAVHADDLRGRRFAPARAGNR